MNSFLTEHIPIWTTAQELKTSNRGRSASNQSLLGIKKLRELILELAVRGKLVPQDPNDEPASVLLRKVEKEKQQLIKKGEIRKPKLLSEITNDEIPFDLPNGWIYSRLNNLGDWGAGATPNRSRHEYYGGNIPWFKSGELNGDYISMSEEFITDLALKETSLRYDKVGDVLIAMYGATIGKTSILEIPATTNQAVCACTPFPGIFNVFLLNLLKAYKSRFIGMGAGGAQPNISREKLIATVIALPPLVEQHRIVAKVDELMALCDELETQQTNSNVAHETLVSTLLGLLTDAENSNSFDESWQRISNHFDILFTTEHSLDQLKQTILQLAVMGKLTPQNPEDEPAVELLKRISKEKARLVKEGKIKKQAPLLEITEDEKPFELPKGWEWVRLGDFELQSEAGWSPNCNLIPRNGENWGVLKVSSVTWGKFNPEENKELPPDLKPIPEFEIKPGDFLISRANTSELVARAVVVPPKAPIHLMMSDKIIRFKFSSWINIDFVNLVNSSQLSRDYYAKVAGGTSSSMKNVSREQIRTLLLALPPLDEQHRIVSKVDELFALCEELKERLVEAQTLQNQLAVAVVEQALN